MLVRGGEVDLVPLWDAAEQDWIALGRAWGLEVELPFVTGFRPLVAPGTRVQRQGDQCLIQARVPWFGAVQRGRGRSGNPVLDSLVHCVGELPEAAIGPLLELVHGHPGEARAGTLRTTVPIGELPAAMRHLLSLRRILSS